MFVLDEAGFGRKKFMFSCSFRCNHICKEMLTQEKKVHIVTVAVTSLNRTHLEVGHNCLSHLSLTDIQATIGFNSASLNLGVKKEGVES
jgi:hypothetical protein